MLSLCAWAGPIGLSIALVLFNLGFARWIIRLIESYREDARLAPVGPAGWLRRLTPELYVGLLPIAGGFIALLAANAAKATLPHVTVTPAVVQACRLISTCVEASATRLDCRSGLQGISSARPLSSGRSSRQSSVGEQAANRAAAAQQTRRHRFMGRRLSERTVPPERPPGSGAPALPAPLEPTGVKNCRDAPRARRRPLHPRAVQPPTARQTACQRRVEE